MVDLAVEQAEDRGRGQALAAARFADQRGDLAALAAQRHVRDERQARRRGADRNREPLDAESAGSPRSPAVVPSPSAARPSRPHLTETSRRRGVMVGASSRPDTLLRLA